MFMNRVHEQCPKIDSGKIPSRTGPKTGRVHRVHCLKPARAPRPRAQRPGRAPAASEPRALRAAAACQARPRSPSARRPCRPRAPCVPPARLPLARAPTARPRACRYPACPSACCACPRAQARLPSSLPRAQHACLLRSAPPAHLLPSPASSPAA